MKKLIYFLSAILIISLYSCECCTPDDCNAIKDCCENVQDQLNDLNNGSHGEDPHDLVLEFDTSRLVPEKPLSEGEGCEKIWVDDPDYIRVPIFEYDWAPELSPILEYSFVMIPDEPFDFFEQAERLEAYYSSTNRFPCDEPCILQAEISIIDPNETFYHRQQNNNRGTTSRGRILLVKRKIWCEMPAE